MGWEVEVGRETHIGAASEDLGVEVGEGGVPLNWSKMNWWRLRSLPGQRLAGHSGTGQESLTGQCPPGRQQLIKHTLIGQRPSKNQNP